MDLKYSKGLIDVDETKKEGFLSRILNLSAKSNGYDVNKQPYNLDFGPNSDFCSYEEIKKNQKNDSIIYQYTCVKGKNELQFSARFKNSQQLEPGEGI